FSRGASTTTTEPPARSTSHASSVALASTSPGTSSARSSAPRRKTCGVCTAHSSERSSVSSTRPARPARLIVSVTGAAAIAASGPPAASGPLAASGPPAAPPRARASPPPASSPSSARASIAASTRSTNSGVSSGRAASWTKTSSDAGPSPAAASARRTDSERTAPPRTPVVPGGAGVSGGSATTIRSISRTRRSASTLHCSSGRPASSTSALGLPTPRRSPRPAATISAIANDSVLFGQRHLVGGRVGEELVEIALRLFLVLVERIHELGGEDLLGPREHLLLPGRETLFALAQREVAHDLGELVDVTGL